ITVLVDAELEAGGAQALTFVVEDTGIGFDGETARRLFTRFAQADGSITRRFGGTGLGLAISLALAEIMGGSIGAESTPGQGSRLTVRLSLPVLGKADAAPGRRPQHAPQEALREGRQLQILLAEDHDINRRVVELIFEGLNVDLTFALDGVEAV